MASPPAPAPPPSGSGAASTPAPVPNPASNAASTSLPSMAPPQPMAAPSIPNLLGRLGSGPPRAGRGGRRGFGGRGGSSRMGPSGSGPSGFQPPSQHGGGMSKRMDHTGIIQSTDTDAALSRMSAVDIGFLEDPFAQYFAGDGGGPAPRRLPIINRGTYTRTQGLDKIIRAFLSGASSRETTPDPSQPESSSPTSQVRQVVSLGAGTDTRCFRLLAQKQADGLPAFQNVVYHEIDFPTVCARKRSIVQSVPAIRSLLTGPVTEHTPLAGTVGIHRSWKAELGNGNELWAHGLDLRELAGGAGSSTSIDGSDKKVVLAGIRTDVPTLLVSECCLCYLQPPEATAVLRWFADRIKPSPTSGLGVVIYEPIRPFDAFGRTMVANLASRGIEMPTLAMYADGAAQEARLRTEAGLARTKHRTIDDIWSAWVPADEQERVNRLEGLDEVEEWGLLASHYVVVWGSQGAYFDAAWSELYGK